MNLETSVPSYGNRGAEAKEKIRRSRGDPLFLADWAEPVFLHFAVDPEVLQPDVPFPLDTRKGKAYITLVAFTMRGMRFRTGGPFTSWMTRPIATHSFLNLRTYVKVGEEAGIYFISEWLNNRIALKLGPSTFGLPYHNGELHYHHNYDKEVFSGTINTGGTEVFRYSGRTDPETDWEPCAPGTLDEFLLERYTAFTSRGNWRGFFRVWHEPWPQKRLREITINNPGNLITKNRHWDWMDHLELVGANVSTGARDVWMGRPHHLKEIL